MLHHDGVPLRIDPRLPLVWRSPDSLQIGVDRPPVVMTGVTNAQERLLAALVGGTSRTALALIADAAAIPAADVDALLSILAPALLPRPVPADPDGVVVTGMGLAADRIRFALDERGLLRTAESHSPALAVIVSHYVTVPSERGEWLRRDIAHLPVVLGDEAVRLGPVVEPGRTACLHCLDLHRRDDDHAWPAIASQLWGRRSSLDTGLLASEVTAQVMRLVDARLAGTPTESATSTSIDAATGSRTTRVWTVHPECGCAVPQGNGLAVGGRPVLHLPTRSQADPVLA